MTELGLTIRSLLQRDWKKKKGQAKNLRTYY